MSKQSFLTTEEGKTALKIREKQRDTLSQKLNGWDNIDLSDSKTRQAVLQAADSIAEFEEKAFVEKSIPLKFLEICSPTKTRPPPFPSGFTLKNLAEKLILNNSFKKTASMEQAKSLMNNKGTNGSDSKRPSLSCITEEDQSEPVEDVSSEDEIIFRPASQEPSSSSTANSRSLWHILSEKKETLASLAEGNKISNIKKKAKKNKKKPVPEETEDEMLERLIKENQKDNQLLASDLVPLDVASLENDPVAEKRQRAVMAYVNRPVENFAEKARMKQQEELNDESFQTQLAKKIARLESMPFSEMLTLEGHTGDYVMNTIDHAVEAFIGDIKNVMRRGMRPENIENWLFEKFKANVVLPNPDEDPKITKARNAFVNDFMWLYTRKYMDCKTDEEKLLSMTYLQLFNHMFNGGTVMIPTIEVLAKLVGTPEFEVKEEAILRTILGQYLTELKCIKRKI